MSKNIQEEEIRDYLTLDLYESNGNDGFDQDDEEDDEEDDEIDQDCDEEPIEDKAEARSDKDELKDYYSNLL